MIFCDKCTKNEEYHTCSECNQHLCISCFNRVHFGINAPRAGRSMVYNKRVFCSEIYAANAKVAFVEIVRLHSVGLPRCNILKETNVDIQG
jgi:hypothetical protein